MELSLVRGPGAGKENTLFSKRAVFLFLRQNYLSRMTITVGATLPKQTPFAAIHQTFKIYFQL